MRNNVLIFGGSGMVGSALRRVFPGAAAPSSDQCELRWDECDDIARVIRWHEPTAVIMAAGYVGGIDVNSRNQYKFLTHNLAMAVNVVEACRQAKVPQLIYLGSSCQYPRRAPQPFRESSLLDGHFEDTNAGYALAKSVGVELCRHTRAETGLKFHSVIPCNLYGPGDNYSDSGHVVGMLLRRFNEAKEAGDDSVTIWGSGQQKREIMHVEDLAAAIGMLVGMDNPPDAINVGSGDHIAIIELARRIAATVGFTGRIECDVTKPEGVQRKLMDSSRMRALGWEPRISLQSGLESAYRAFLESEHAETVRT